MLVRELLLSIWRFVLAGRGCLLVFRTALTVPLLVVSFRVGKVEDTLGERVWFVKSYFVNFWFGTGWCGSRPLPRGLKPAYFLGWCAGLKARSTGVGWNLRMGG